MALKVDNSRVQEYQWRMSLSKSHDWARETETVAEWLATCPEILRSWGLGGALHGFSFLKNSTVKEVLGNVARSVNVPLASVYAVGEKEQWIKPGSRKFDPLREQKPSDDYPDESTNPAVRRPKYIAMKVTEVEAADAEDCKPPQQDPNHPGYLSDEDPFPEEAILVPYLKSTLKDLCEREEAFSRALDSALALSDTIQPEHERTLAGTIDELRKSCYKGANQLVIPEALMREPNPCGISETWRSFLNRVYVWMLQKWYPCFQFHRLFVSTTMFDTLMVLATANDPQLHAYIVGETPTDAFSFSDMDDLFAHFRTKYGQIMDLRYRGELRRLHENRNSGSYNVTSQGFNRACGRNSSNGRKRRGTRQKGNPAKRS